MKLYFLRKWKLKFQYERADMKQYQLPAPLLKNISLSICPAICPSLHPSFLPTFHFRVTLAPVMSNHWSLLQNQGFILYTDLSKYEEGLWVLQGEQRTLQGAVGAGGRAGMQRKGFPVGMTAPWKKPSHGQALHLWLWLGCAGGTGGEMCAWGWLGIHNQKCWSGILKKVQLHSEHKIKHAVENCQEGFYFAEKKEKKSFSPLMFLTLKNLCELQLLLLVQLVQWSVGWGWQWLNTKVRKTDALNQLDLDDLYMLIVTI